MLWMIGQDIDRRVKLHQSAGGSEDALDESDLFFVSSFITAHNLYIQCFDATNKIMEDLERSTRLYARLDNQAKLGPWQLLSELGKARSVVEQKSGDVMQTASAGLAAGTETQGMIAIGLGLLRGALHAIGGVLIGGASRILTKTAVELGKDGLIAIMKQEGFLQSLLTFMHVNLKSLMQLSVDIPNYFGWLHRLLEVFRIT